MGKNSREVGYEPATQADLDRYAAAERQLAQMQVPLLLDTTNPHQRLYIAAMDGTNNSIYDDPEEEWSAVGKLHTEIQSLKNPNIHSGYVEGIGTQDGSIARKWDGVTGYTFDERLETAYYEFCVQAKEWIDEDPQAEIRVAGVGFSRGAELSAALSQLIYERGIMDPVDAKVKWNDGLVEKVEYTRGHLVPPGQTLQSLVLFDPVATNITEHDRRIPPSVISGIALMSEDRRDQFKGTQHFPDGLSEGNRFYSVVLPGAHSDIGNAYPHPRDGLGILSHNLAVDYLNSLSNENLLKKQNVAQEPPDYAIHRSKEHLIFYSTRGFRDGQRDFINQLGPERQCRIDPQPDCTQKAPHDAALAGQVEWQNVRISPANAEPPRLQADNQVQMEGSVDAMFMHMTDAAMRGDRVGMIQVGQAYRESPAGQAWLQEGREHHQAQQAAQEKQQAEQQNQQQLEQQQTEVRRGPIMR